eukprot:TRINITY_DN3188_c0_g1_i1.p1 TRINITY_DN3188_c0_g1~~TRINITY_DN3188_c0_g1_i1.p1  ORF type:complete len:1117 (-),score=151.80 TRINITY_DN3188_c0_g1_i1:42-3392(-)
MIQCERCEVWQHKACVIGFKKEPEHYFCQDCRQIQLLCVCAQPEENPKNEPLKACLSCDTYQHMGCIDPSQRDLLPAKYMCARCHRKRRARTARAHDQLQLASTLQNEAGSVDPMRSAPANRKRKEHPTSGGENGSTTPSALNSATRLEDDYSESSRKRIRFAPSDQLGQASLDAKNQLQEELLERTTEDRGKNSSSAEPGADPIVPRRAAAGPIRARALRAAETRAQDPQVDATASGAHVMQSGTQEERSEADREASEASDDREEGELEDDDQQPEQEVGEEEEEDDDADADDGEEEEEDGTVGHGISPVSRRGKGEDGARPKARRSRKTGRSGRDEDEDDDRDMHRHSPASQTGWGAHAGPAQGAPTDFGFDIDNPPANLGREERKILNALRLFQRMEQGTVKKPRPTKTDTVPSTPRGLKARNGPIPAPGEPSPRVAPSASPITGQATDPDPSGAATAPALAAPNSADPTQQLGSNMQQQQLARLGRRANRSKTRAVANGDGVGGGTISASALQPSAIHTSLPMAKRRNIDDDQALGSPLLVKKRRPRLEDHIANLKMKKELAQTVGSMAARFDIPVQPQHARFSKKARFLTDYEETRRRNVLESAPSPWVREKPELLQQLAESSVTLLKKRLLCSFMLLHSSPEPTAASASQSATTIPAAGESEHVLATTEDPAVAPGPEPQTQPPATATPMDTTEDALPGAPPPGSSADAGLRQTEDGDRSQKPLSLSEYRNRRRQQPATAFAPATSPGQTIMDPSTATSAQPSTQPASPATALVAGLTPPSLSTPTPLPAPAPAPAPTPVPAPAATPAPTPAPAPAIVASVSAAIPPSPAASGPSSSYSLQPSTSYSLAPPKSTTMPASGQPTVAEGDDWRPQPMQVGPPHRGSQTPQQLMQSPGGGFVHPVHGRVPPPPPPPPMSLGASGMPPPPGLRELSYYHPYGPGAQMHMQGLHPSQGQPQQLGQPPPLPAHHSHHHPHHPMPEYLQSPSQQGPPPPPPRGNTPTGFFAPNAGGNAGLPQSPYANHPYPVPQQHGSKFGPPPPLPTFNGSPAMHSNGPSKASGPPPLPPGLRSGPMSPNDSLVYSGRSQPVPQPQSGKAPEKGYGRRSPSPPKRR